MLRTMPARSLPIYLLVFSVLLLVAYNMLKDQQALLVMGNGAVVSRDVSGKVCPEECRNQVNCPIRLLENETDFEEYFNKVEGKCSEWKEFGTYTYRGLKYVCLDPKFNIKPGNCHVLSFGICDEWSFDDAMDQFNCKVYSFDPTMNRDDFNRSKNIQFFRLGIGSVDGKQKVGMVDKWSMEPVNRYVTILKRLGLSDTPIDYIKLDVEYSELDFFMDVFMRTPEVLKNIKQIGMEVHYEPKGLGHYSRYQMFWVAFQVLRCHGFQLYHSRKCDQWHEVVWARDDIKW